MAQNISLLGADYSAVPSVLLPKTGGGTASFTDVTDTTAAAADVAAGKYFYTASGVRTLGTGSGGGGTGTITQDQDGYLVLSPDGGGGGGSTGLEYETGTWTPTADIARGTISFTNTHTTAPVIVEISDVEPSTSPTDSNRSMDYCNIYALHGGAVYISDTSSYYGLAQYVYISSSGGVGGSRTPITTTTGSSQTSQPGYWADSTAFYPYSNNATRYWRAGRTYKWIAIWAPST